MHARTRFIVKLNRIMAFALPTWFVTLPRHKQYNYHTRRFKLGPLISVDLPHVDLDYGSDYVSII